MRSFTRGKEVQKRAGGQSTRSFEESMRDSGEVVSGPRKVPNATEQRVDSDKELSEIRKEVIESRNLVIKTDNLLKSLHAEVKAFGRRQEDFEKRQWISSATAYLVFAVLIVAASLLVGAARSWSAKSEKQRMQKTIEELTAKQEKDRADLQLAQAASRRAADVYRQMTTGSGDDRLNGVEALASLDTSRVSLLEKQALNDRAEAVRNEIGQEALERGKAAFRKSDMKGVIRDLARFLAMKPSEAEALDASYYLGVAYSVSKRYEEAVPLLARFVAQDKKAKSRDYAMLLLAHSYEQTGQLDKAAQIVREAIGTYPNSDFATQFRTRLHAIQKGTAGGAEAATTQSGGKSAAVRNPSDATQAASAQNAGR